MNIRKNLAVVGAALAMTTSILTVASPAQAASRDGVCDSGEFCYFYNSNYAGSISDFTGSIEDYGTTQPSCYEFKGAGAGQGLCVKNNAASVWNRTSKTVVVYYNSNFAGASQSFAAGAKANLNATLKNNNASHNIGGTSGTYPADPRAAEAVAFAKARLGHTDWNNQCELFVERAFGTSGRFATARTHYQWQKDNGRIHTGSVPPAGTAVFFTSTTSAGHVMLSIGGNSAISTGPSVYQTNTFRDRSDYLGWAYVPSGW
ncbi:peptidase inhibitor family I36 protein [Micromonospora halotolerans]|uniref:Peptidase inhibitor family I36 protein n=1 Tax=Micromonospora halotolerans TaxID=709879 RepID=A0ABY9ZVJ0_9ACTN|nr:peptidase inhibitor family I36 protein [Micromonospora halotolerans]WNM39304.1 peptidase inhibitor family I36 protein [Micromonospora halotolerans]